jgi:hypothetical protein
MVYGIAMVLNMAYGSSMQYRGILSPKSQKQWQNQKRDQRLYASPLGKETNKDNQRLYATALYRSSQFESKE